MIFYYLYDGSKPLGSTPLAAFQKGRIHCQKEVLLLARRLYFSFEMIAFWARSYMCNSVYLQVFPALFPYITLVCRSRGTREKNWTPPSCLGSCLLVDKKGQGQSTKPHTLVEETDVKRFRQGKKKKKKSGKKSFETWNHEPELPTPYFDTRVVCTPVGNATFW